MAKTTDDAALDLLSELTERLLRLEKSFAQVSAVLVSMFPQHATTLTNIPAEPAEGG